MADIKRKRRRKRRNRSLAVALVALLVVILAVAVVLVALRGVHDRTPETSEPTSGVTEVKKAEKTLPRSFIDRNTSSPYILLCDVTSNRVLYSKNADLKAYPASLTKLMTAIVSCDYLKPDDTVTVGNEINMIDPQSSRAYLTIGTRLTFTQALEAMLLPSGNDAAYVLAVNTGRKIAGKEDLGNNEALSLFCQKMNEKARELGCAATHFANPDGIHRDDHYTTAADMVKIAVCALNQETVAGVVSKPAASETLLSGQSVTWKNSNKLIQENSAYSYAGATGMKTGSTDEAGYCLVASAVREGKTCVAVVMGSKTESGRWEDASGLLDIGFR